jgi:predicted CoA-binding protein
MNNLKDAALDFLAQKRIAVAGVSRQGDLPANLIYRKLRETGHDVFAVNPNADRVEGDVSYPDLAAIPIRVDAAVIATPPQVTLRLVQQCGNLGIRRVWIHRSFGRGSLDDSALSLCRQLGLSVIPGSCPMMFCEPVDLGHRCMRWFLRVSRGLPEAEGY